MSKVIIYDFEVFRYDSLLGANIIDENGKSKIYQTWNFDEIKSFYLNHKNDLWIGHNNGGYDGFILDAIYHDENPFLASQQITQKSYTTKRRIKMYSVDLMRLKAETYSLKLTELLCGKNIHTTEVDFLIKRPLTEEERKLTEEYNRSDLEQTTYNYNKMYDLIKLKFDIIKEFKLDLYKNLELPGVMIAANILNAKYMPSLKYATVEPVMYDNLIIENQDVIDYYMKKGYKSNEGLTITMEGIELSLGNGGIHGAEKKCFSEKVIYVDVKGYYNLLALKYDLLPRNLSSEAKQKYKHMYETQLELKKTNPVKRESYKVILLAVIGSMFRENSPFYDPENYLMLTVLGQLFIIDLLEKLKGLVKIIQVNTDGVMLEPYDWTNENKIIEIIKAWENRTGFDIKIDNLFTLWQRDVNNYCCFDAKNNVIFKGEALKNYDISDKAYAQQSFFKCKEPPIVAQGIVNFLLFGIEPEVYVSQHKKQLKLFQYACSIGGYDYLTYDTFDLVSMEHSTERLQKVNRVFALKSKSISGTVNKHRERYGKHSQSKYPALPDNVFIYNKALDDVTDDFYEQIDYQYYVDRIYKKINDFVN